ncbi:MAG: hypothetical protein FJW30_17480 [Acidobacteria bacterium]|nr:hypothetical protein [Acidobacteriota bacterium]
MPTTKAKSKTVRIGIYNVTLLPGETQKRIRDITREVNDEWEPACVLERCECDTIVHARFKLERYERFREHFVRSGIRETDIREAERSYRASLQLAEESLRAVQRMPHRKPPSRAKEIDLATMPVRAMVQ